MYKNYTNNVAFVALEKWTTYRLDFFILSANIHEVTTNFRIRNLKTNNYES